MTYAEDAPCETCWKPVHLQHDPPAECGCIRCPECHPCSCDLLQETPC